MIYPFSQTNSRKVMRFVSATAAAFLCATMFTGCFKKDAGPSTDPSSGPNLVDTATTEVTSAPTEATTVATTEAPKENVAVVKEKVNTYSSPSLESNILQTLDAGDEVTVNRVEIMPVTGLTWAYIPLKGWVQTDYLDMTNVTIQGSNSTPAGSGSTTATTAPAATTATTGGNTSTTYGKSGTVTASELRIRQSAASTAAVVGSYKKGDKVTVLETSNGWGRTDKGWISLNYVSFGTTTGATNTGNTGNTGTTTGTTTTTGGTKGVVTATQLNIRESAATTAAQKGSYSYGDRITILETSNGWGRTDKGWVSLNYVYQDGTTGTKTAKGLVTGTTLNVRSGPGTNYDVVGSYSQGDSVEIYAQFTINNTVWGCTNKGWVSMDYVEVG